MSSSVSSPTTDGSSSRNNTSTNTLNTDTTTLTTTTTTSTNLRSNSIFLNDFSWNNIKRIATMDPVEIWNKGRDTTLENPYLISSYVIVIGTFLGYGMYLHHKSKKASKFLNATVEEFKRRQQSAAAATVPKRNTSHQQTDLEQFPGVSLPEYAAEQVHEKKQ